MNLKGGLLWIAAAVGSMILIFGLLHIALAKDKPIQANSNGATISISSPADVDLGHLTGKGTSVSGSADWVVTTDNSTGYTLTIKASQAPAMKSISDSLNDYFDDYREATTGTPEFWVTESAKAKFGFTASGDHVPSGFGSGTKYIGFDGVTEITVAQSASPATDATTTITFKAEIGSSKLLPSGSYQTTVTATAVTNP